MKIHFIQHVAFEYPGSLIDWTAEHNHTISFTKIFESIAFPALTGFDMLVIMGGPMGVYEEEKYDWLKKEKPFIKSAIDAKKKVLGICLGAQFIADVLGAKVYPHTLKEIGWWPVEKVNNHPLVQHLPQQFTTFHWHGDTFTLPEGAIHLFKSKGCEQQGFIYNNHVAGLQFHMEVKPDLLNGMTEHERRSLIPEGFVQSEQDIVAGIEKHIPFQKEFMTGFVETFARL